MSENGYYGRCNERCTSRPPVNRIQLVKNDRSNENDQLITNWIHFV